MQLIIFVNTFKYLSWTINLIIYQIIISNIKIIFKKNVRLEKVDMLNFNLS